MSEEQIINLDNIPQTWGIATLTDMALKEKNAIKRGPFGSAIKKSFFVPKGYKVYEQQNVIYNDFHRGKYFISDEKYKELESFKVNNGDVLMSCSGTVGKLAVVPNDLEKGVINQALLKISLDNDVIDTKFFVYLFGFNIDRILSQNTRGSAMLNISSVKDLKKIQFPLPSPSEQHRIVSKIDELLTKLDAGIESLKQVQTLLKRYRQSVLKSAVEGKLTSKWHEKHKDELEPADKLLERILKERKEKWEAEQLANFKAKGKKPPNNWQNKYKEPTPPDTSKLPELPEGWVWVNLEQLGNVIGGLTKNQKRKNHPLSFPYLRVANVYADELRLDDVQEIGVTEAEVDRVLLKKNDLLIVEGNGSKDQIGRVALWNELILPCVHQNHIIKVRLIFPDYAKFILYWLLSIEGRNQITQVASSTSGLYTLSISKVSSLPIPLAPLKEQEIIIDEIENLTITNEKAEQIVSDELKRSQSLRQSILKQAFEGKLVPQDPNDEPASVLLEKIKAEKSNPNKSKQMEMF